MALLPYEKQALMDVLSDDCLVVFAEGIYYENIILSFLSTFSNPGSLVAVIDCPERLENWFIEKLACDDSTTAPPRKVTSDLHVRKRGEHYLSGGVQFLSKRILIIDILQKRIPVDLISGLVFFNAHSISDISIESFITRLYRTDNISGFIKAFSLNPIQLSRFNQIEKTLKYLFLPKYHLWPRFHVNIADSIEKHKCDVVELHIPLTDIMKNLQLCIIDLLHFSLKELKKHVPQLDADFLAVENAISLYYFRSLKNQLEHIWSTLGENTKQLVQDIKMITSLNNELVQHDAVKFYRRVHKLRAAVSYKKSRVALWMFTEAFEKLLVLSKKRVELREDGVSSIELSPKWEGIQEILSELKTESSESKNILFCVSSIMTAEQIVQFIKYGELNTLKQDLSNERNLKFAGEQSSVNTGSMNQTMEYGLEKSHNIYFLVYTKNINMDEYLTAIDPTYIILYDPHLFLVRSFEMFRCRRPGKPLRIYFLIYDNSIEEQRYLTHLSKERKAFEDMIILKGNMTVHTDQDGKRGLNPLLERGKQGLKFSDTEKLAENSRKGGLNKNGTFPKVIVDMREFGSPLPSILHKSGLDIIPKTFEVGDYILTPDICIERKSISDLIGSLASGRLYQQCQAMCRTYKHPMLLIEFEESKGFSLQNHSAVSDSVVTESIQTQLALITLHFPNMRMMWSESEYTTSNIFLDLKKDKDEPSVEDVESVTKYDSIYSSEFNHQVVDALLTLPGIDSKNYTLIARKYTNLYDLAGASQAELSTILGNNQNANKLFYFFNQKELPESNLGSNKQSAKNKYAKFKKFRKQL